MPTLSRSDELKQIITAIRNANIQYLSPDEPHRVLALGVGSLQKWYVGRKTFNELAHAIYQKVILRNTLDKRQAKLVPKIADKYISVHWLGYYVPDSVYGIDNTVFNSVPFLATGINMLFERYKAATTFDLVCHSLMGTVAIYGALAGLYDVSRVRSIITINSPLKGSDDYREAFHLYFGVGKKPFMKRPIGKEEDEPQVFADLQKKSVVMMTLKNATESPVSTLVNIVTEGDQVVKPRNGKVRFATRQLTIRQADLSGENVNFEMIHTDVLKTKKLTEVIVTELLK